VTNTTLIGYIQSISKDGKASIKVDSPELVHFTAPNADLIRTLASCFIGNTLVVVTLSPEQALVYLAEAKPIQSV